MDLLRQHIAASLLLALSYSASHQAQAIDFTPDAVSVWHGKYTDTFLKRKADISNNRLSLRWNWDKDWLDSSNFTLGGYFDLGYSQWRSHLSKADPDTSAGADKIWAVSFSPILRFQYKTESILSPFIDIGGGISYQSEQDIQKKRPTDINMGGHTQFEARAMIGTQVNTSQSFEIAFGMFHYSNANLHPVNEALDFYLFNITLSF